MKNLIKKELLVSLRTTKVLLLFICIVHIMATLYINKDIYSAIDNRSFLNSAFVYAIMLFPIMLIPLFSTILINAVMTEEKNEKIVQVLFANGVRIQQMWWSRVIVVTSISYLGNLLATIIAFIYIRVVYNMWLDFTIQEILNLFIMFPLISIAIVHIICLLMWISKTAQVLIPFIPSVAYIGCTYLISVQPSIAGKMNTIAWQLIILIFVVMIIVGCEMIVKKVNREHLVNVNS